MKLHELSTHLEMSSSLLAMFLVEKSEQNGPLVPLAKRKRDRARQTVEVLESDDFGVT